MSQASASATTSNQMSLLSWFLLLLLGCLWGGAFFSAKIAVSQIPALPLVFLRVFIASIALWAYAAVAGIAVRLTYRDIPIFLLLGLINNVLPFSLLFWSQQYIPSGLAAVLNAFTPIFTMLLAQIATSDERLSVAKVVAAILGLGGVAVLVGQDAFAGEAGVFLPQVLCLTAALSYAFAFMLAKRMQGYSTYTLAAGQLTGASVLLIPVLFISWNPGQSIALVELASVSSGVWVAVGALALVCTAACYLIYFKLIRDAGSTNASLVTLIVPLSAILLGYVFLGEKLQVNHWIGGALIFTALLLISGRIKLGRNRA
ncbi:DMT family transporter [Polycladidibacter hongkongensis]|uniref:DMT family transporter n=1 Tax=Polycladidibacter hongkongensis TaxID=1647556 RepID=UPI001AD93E32|nr:DMT family transporter [Pseudovibrio hongkongensis]